MDAHKILNFQKIHPNFEFPVYKILDDSRKKELIKFLMKNLKIPNNLNGIALSRKIYDKSTIAGRVLDDSFNLDDFLMGFKYSANKKIYLNWGNFESIEEISKFSLNKNFFDIWYPSVDDLDIFDENCNWLLSVTHHGIVKVLVNTEEY